MNVTATRIESKAEYSFTDQDFRKIAELVKAKYGLFLQESKRALVYSRLAKRLRVLDLESFGDYCELLNTPQGDSEQSHLLTALTTNVTHFFREKHHFDQLREDILPQLAQSARDGATIRIWSAACSAGQEAYCLAATVLAVFPNAARFDFKILATDVDPIVLENARSGKYALDQKKAIPAEYVRQMLDPKASEDNTIEMHSRLRELISFGQLNLIDTWPMKKPFDVIMCRNAAIYFDKSTQTTLWSRFEQALKLGGHLMIGHSERLSGPAAEKFESVGTTAYKKIHAT